MLPPQINPLSYAAAPKLPLSENENGHTIVEADDLAFNARMAQPFAHHIPQNGSGGTAVDDRNLLDAAIGPGEELLNVAARLFLVHVVNINFRLAVADVTNHPYYSPSPM
jgi:hypothetical protein